MTPLQRLIEHARRQQHKQKRGIPSKQPELPLFDSGRPELGAEVSAMFGQRLDVAGWIDGHTAMRVSRERTSVEWASEEEALEQWRRTTMEDWGFGRYFD